MKYLLVILGTWGLVHSMETYGNYSTIFILLICIGLISWSWENIKLLNSKLEKTRDGLFKINE